MCALSCTFCGVGLENWGAGVGGGGEPTENQRTKGNRKQNAKKPTVWYTREIT